MRYRFWTADVFTDRVFGGNPLAVFPRAEGLDTRRMQLVAREFNLSETTFVLPPDDPAHTRRVRIFTPAAELPSAGHPTVGTAFVLAAIGEIGLAAAGGGWTQIVFEEGVGPVPVAIRAGADGRPAFARLSVARLPEFGPPAPGPDDLAAALSLEVSDLEAGGDAEAASCGVPFLFVRLRDRDALRRARPNRVAWERALAGYWAPQVFALTFDAERPGSDVRGRMFAPTLGIEEDPATGAAAAALAGYLGARSSGHGGDGTLRWIVEQGFEMGRPSILEVEADRGAGGALTAVRVGGAAVLVSEGEMVVPDS